MEALYNVKRATLQSRKFGMSRIDRFLVSKQWEDYFGGAIQITYIYVRSHAYKAFLGSGQVGSTSI